MRPAWSVDPATEEGREEVTSPPARIGENPELWWKNEELNEHDRSDRPDGQEHGPDDTGRRGRAATGIESTAVHRFLVNGERPTRAEWDAEIAEADALVENQGPYRSSAEWPEWTDGMRFTIDPDAYEGEGHGEHGEDLGPADPADECEDLDAPDFDPESLPDWLEPEPTADADRMTLTEWLAFTRDAFRAIGSEAANLVAEAIGDLVAECRVLGCPADASTFYARREAMLRD